MTNTFLQKSLKQLKCQQQGHEDQPLNYICINQDCSNNSIICYLCYMQYHEKHDKIPLKVFFNKLINLSSKCQQLITESAQIDKIFISIQKLIKQSQQVFANRQLIQKTFQQFRQLTISSSLKFYQLDQQVSMLLQAQSSNLMSNLISFIKQYYYKYFSQIKQTQWPQLNLTHYLLQRKKQELNTIVQFIEKLKTTGRFNDTNVLNLFPLVQEQHNKIKVVFSQDLKPPGMTILAPTHVKYQKSGSQRLIVLEPCLNKTNSIKKWGVKIVKLASWIGVGVCHINQIKKAKYMFNYTTTGHGSYLISSNGYSWSSYKKEFNSHFQPFTYTTGDIIHIQYDPKERLVHFKKQSDPNGPTFKLQIQANDDPIHPQLNLTGIGDEIQIINF